MAELLQNYGSWLLIGGLMFFMMRKGGCCGGNNHSSHDNHDNHGNHDNHNVEEDKKLIKGGSDLSHCVGDNEKSTTLNVEGMTCGHCKASVENAVTALSGVSKVDVDLTKKKVSIIHDSGMVTEESLRLAIINQGYRVS